MYKKSDYIALFISVLLHGLLVFLPWKEDPLPSAESSPPTDSISVVDLPTLPAVPPAPPEPADPPPPPTPAVPSTSPGPVVPPASPAPAAPPAPPEPPIPSASPTPPAPVAPPPASPKPAAPPALPPVAPPAAPTADLPPEEPNTETSNSPTDQPVSEPAPETDEPPEEPAIETSNSPIDEAKIAADWENLVGYLQRQEEGFASFTLLEIFNFFGEPDQANQFFDENNQPKLDVLSFYLFSEQMPEQVLQTVVRPKLFNSTGFELQRQENVSAGLAYQLSQGEMLRYLIIVKLREGEGSVLMLSDSLQGLES